MATLIITEKTSQAKDLRAALGNRFGQILPAEGHLLRPREAPLREQTLQGFPRSDRCSTGWRFPCSKTRLAAPAPNAAPSISAVLGEPAPISAARMSLAGVGSASIISPMRAA
jgi:hypothetical protein